MNHKLFISGLSKILLGPLNRWNQ